MGTLKDNQTKPTLRRDSSQLSSSSDHGWMERRDASDAVSNWVTQTHTSHETRGQDHMSSQKHSLHLRRQPELAAATGKSSSPSRSRDPPKHSQINTLSPVDESRKGNSNARAPPGDSSIEASIGKPEAAAGGSESMGPNTPTEDVTPRPLEDGPSAKLPFARIPGAEDVMTKKQRRIQYETSNRTCLSSLAAHSTALSDGLDDTYYNLLDKTATIRSTLRSLRDLPSLTSDLVVDINNEAAGIEQDNKKLIASFDGFKDQLRRIDEFQDRIHAGREKLANLQERIGSVSKDIDAWNHKEGEWQARVSRRLRLLWAAIGVLLFAVLLAVIIDQFRPMSLPGISDTESSTGVGESANLSMAEAPLSQGVCQISPSDRHVCHNTDDGNEMKTGIASQSSNASIKSRLDEGQLQRFIDEL